MTSKVPQSPGNVSSSSLSNARQYLPSSVKRKKTCSRGPTQIPSKSSSVTLATGSRSVSLGRCWCLSTTGKEQNKNDKLNGATAHEVPPKIKSPTSAEVGQECKWDEFPFQCWCEVLHIVLQIRLRFNRIKKYPLRCEGDAPRG